MTEAEWLASTDPAAMGAAITKRRRGSSRVLRLFVAAFWHWQSYRLKGCDEQMQLRVRAALVAQWAESGTEPAGTESGQHFVGFNRKARQAFLTTVRAPGQWSTSGTPAVKRAVWLLREVFGNPFALRRKRKTDPFRGNMFDSSWRTDTAVALSLQMYNANDFSAMPILADALQDAGCTNEDLLSHCRGAGGGAGEPVGGSPARPDEHVRGCWVVDLVLGRE